MSRHRTRADEHGFAMYAAILVAILVGGVITTLAHSARRDANDTRLEIARNVSLAAADGGIELARARLARDAAYTGERTTIGSTSVTVQVEVVSSEEPRRWLVRSVATQRPESVHGLPVVRVIEARLRAETGLPSIATWRAL